MNNIAVGTAEAARRAGSGRVTDVVIGLGYTLICLEEERCGISYTPREHLEAGCEVFDAAGTLSGKELDELLGWIGGGSPMACSLGLAAANSVLRPPGECLGVDLLDTLDLRSGESVVTVGRFKPMEAAFESRGVELDFIEWGDPPDALFDCDVAVITATTIINNTLGPLLEKVGGAREVALLGPSTPYAPDAFSDTPVTILAGSVVDDEERVRRVISEGGGTRTMGRALAKWVARV